MDNTTISIDEGLPLVDSNLSRKLLRSHSRDVHVLSLAFLLVFSAYGAVQNLESTVNAVSQILCWVYKSLFLLSMLFNSLLSFCSGWRSGDNFFGYFVRFIRRIFAVCVASCSKTRIKVCPGSWNYWLLAIYSCKFETKLVTSAHCSYKIQYVSNLIILSMELQTATTKDQPYVCTRLPLALTIEAGF